MVKILTTQQIKNHLNNVLEKTDFKIGEKSQGDERDSYSLKDKTIIVATDRISCFNSFIGAVPFKGQALNQIAAFWFERTKDIIPNHIIDMPDPNVMVVKKYEPIEVDVRAYMTDSLWSDYEKGKRDMYGIDFKERILKNQVFENPIVIPIKKNIISEKLRDKIEDTVLRLFERGTEVCRENNLILVNAKYKFGLVNGKLVLVDEIHTPDSSRFWYLHSYHQLFNQGKEPKQLDKEYVKQWLVKKNFNGKGKVPKLTDKVKIEAARSYIELYEGITGEDFEVSDKPIKERIENNLKDKGYL